MVIDILLLPIHNQLKSYYFGRTRNICMDRMIYILLQIILLVINRIMYVFSLMQNEIAESIDVGKAIYMVTKNIDNTSCLVFYGNMIKHSFVY